VIALDFSPLSALIADFPVLIAGAAETLAENDRMFGLDAQTFWQVSAQLFNVALLCFVMTKLLYKPVKAALQKRTDRIEGQLSEAEEELAKAQELRLSYEKKMEEAGRERDEILSEARKTATETSTRLINEAKKEAESIRERTASNVALEWERAESDMRTAIIDVSAVMAEKFVSLAINKETHDRLFNETMTDLEGMTWRD